ncbi:hypothetical protein BROUX41_006124 [Berkeleyomyces rouxiae]
MSISYDDSRRPAEETPKSCRSALPEAPSRAPLQSSSQAQSTSQGPDARREAWDAPVERTYKPTSYPDVVDGNKRKRSLSPIGGRRELPAPQSQHHQTNSQVMSSPESNGQALPALARDAYSTPQTEYSSSDARYRNQSSREPQSQPSTQTSTEDVEALRRAAAQGEHNDYSQGSPEADDRTVYSFSADQQCRDSSVMTASDQKKRKRNFSNRTKTGCLTCRRRKKKCDEQKPECSNCIKGGFLCAGYQPQRGPLWPKAETKAPATLEPKESSYMSPPSGPAYSATSAPYSSSIPASKRDQMQHYRGQQLRIDPPQTRSILNDEDRPTPSTISSAPPVTSPENKLAAISSFTGNAFPTPISANPGPALNFSDRMSKDPYSRVPPLHDIGRPTSGSQLSEMSHTGNANSLPQINILNPTRSNSPSMSAQASQVAQIALSHGSFSQTSPQVQHQQVQQQQQQHHQAPPQRTQKEEMLAGRNYFHRDRELTEERDRCTTACWRFNNATLPQNGISSQERARLFHDILHPAGSSPNRFGETSVIEGSFTCDYGYNLAIGQNVLISRDCKLQDAAPITIGDNCHIGPDVKLYTATVSTDPKRRGAAGSSQSAKPITIEADCFIGGGAVILPGVTIGKGSTVGAGSVVTRNVPPMTVAVGNPARVVRGVST